MAVLILGKYKTNMWQMSDNFKARKYIKDKKEHYLILNW